MKTDERFYLMMSNGLDVNVRDPFARSIYLPDGGRHYALIDASVRQDPTARAQLIVRGALDPKKIHYILLTHRP